ALPHHPAHNRVAGVFNPPAPHTNPQNNQNALGRAGEFGGYVVKEKGSVYEKNTRYTWTPFIG
nr:hypothetical protein [Desulfobacula sp.]